MDKTRDSIYKKKQLSLLILNGFKSTIYSHKALFKTLRSENYTHEMPVVLAYLTEAHNYFVNAQTFLIDNLEVFGEHIEFEYLFHRFSVYNDELLTNVRTAHDYRWSNLEFEKFVASFNHVASLLDIDKDAYWRTKALLSEDE